MFSWISDDLCCCVEFTAVPFHFLLTRSLWWSWSPPPLFGGEHWLEGGRCYMTTRVTRGSVFTSVFASLDSEPTKPFKAAFKWMRMLVEQRPFLVIRGLYVLYIFCC